MAELDPLIRRAQRGEQAACRELYLRHQQDVLRIVVRTIGPDADLDDVVQEAFVQLFRSLPSYRGQSRFSTWLYRVVTNTARMHIRRKRSRPRLTSLEAPPEVPPEGNSRPPPPGPEQEALRQERMRALYGLLDRLSEKKRTVLVLHDLQGVSPREIAEVVEAPVLTVRTRLFYARKELLAAMAGDPVLAGLMDNSGEEST